MKGWVSLHRKILDNPIVCKDSDYFSVWCYLLLNATHDDYDVEFNGNRITLEPGQLITGRKSISAKFNINESKVQRILKKLEIEHQIEQQTGNKNRLVTVLNWSLYQGSEQQIEQQVNNNRTTSEQQVNTNNNIITKQHNNNKYLPDSHEYRAANFNATRVMAFNKKISHQMTNKTPDDKLDTSTGDGLDTSTGDGLDTQDKEPINNTINNVSEVLKYYKENCLSLPQPRKITDQRKKTINARLTDYGFEDVIKGLDSAERSEFLKKSPEKTWLTFDWIFNPNNFIKIIEGKYTAKEKTQTNMYDMSRKVISKTL